MNSDKLSYEDKLAIHGHAELDRQCDEAICLDRDDYWLRELQKRKELSGNPTK
jgi:hypothetical protein